MNTVAVNHDVFDAFLRRESSKVGDMLSDGSRLYSKDGKIAEWKEGVLAINPAVGSHADEARKDALVDYILRKIQREELLWALVKPEPRQLRAEVSVAG